VVPKKFVEMYIYVARIFLFPFLHYYSSHKRVFFMKKRVLRFIPGLVPPMPLPERAPPPRTDPWI
jgi:hypothetical protein